MAKIVRRKFRNAGKWVLGSLRRKRLLNRARGRLGQLIGAREAARKQRGWALYTRQRARQIMEHSLKIPPHTQQALQAAKRVFGETQNESAADIV